MKFPKFNFDDSYPLTLGVADDYFTLSTRLKRIGRAPMQPRRRAAWLLGAALAVSFAAVVPLRLTARAQNEQKAATLSGVVRDQSGIAVADATVYLSLRNRAEQLETTTSDADGRFAFNSEIGDNRSVIVWADAGARGLGQAYISQGKSGGRLSNPIIAPLAPVKLLLVAPDGKRAANVGVRIGQMGPEIDEQWIVPRPISSQLQTQTNARGEAVFAGLPTGQIAQFWMSDQKYYQTKVGFGDLRGGQFAPLSADESVKIGQQKDWKTIRLVAPVTLRGNVASRVSTPMGIGVSGALVTAIRFSVWKAEEFSVPMTPQARTDAQGNYTMAGLRPGSYRVQVESETWLARSSVSPVETRELKAPSGRVDLALSGGGLIRGVVRIKGTQSPAVGQNIGVIDAKRNYQVTKTDARGAFEFRANAGRALIWTQNGAGSLPAQLFNEKFTITAFEMREYSDKNNDFRSVMTMTGGKIIITPKDYRPSNRDIEISGSQLVWLPVKEGATREITIETSPQTSANTAKKPQRTGPATLNGKVSLPGGEGLNSTIVLRPASSDDMTKAIYESADSQGFYSIKGLQPGRYRIAVELDGVTARDWVAPTLTRTLEAGANRADIRLTRGALITGTVISKASKRPLKNIEIVIADADGDGLILTSDARGRFQRRVAPGATRVRVQKAPNGATLRLLDKNAAPQTVQLPAYTSHLLNLKNGDKRTIQFELPAATKPTPAATPTGTITGTARDESGAPLAGVRVWAYTQRHNRGIGSAYSTTKADGKYRFDNFPAGGKVAVIAKRKGYGVLPTPNDDAFGLDFRSLAAGQTRVLDVTMRVAPATLAGKVLKSDGTLAVNYHVSPQNMKRTGTTTKANGKFWLAGVFIGPRTLYVYDPMSRKRWGPYRAADNQRDLVLRLSEKTRDKNYVLGGVNR